IASTVRAGARTSQGAGPTTLIAPWDCRAPARQRFRWTTLMPPPARYELVLEPPRGWTGDVDRPLGLSSTSSTAFPPDNTDATASKVRAGARTSQEAVAGTADRPLGLSSTSSTAFPPDNTEATASTVRAGART